MKEKEKAKEVEKKLVKELIQMGIISIEKNQKNVLEIE